MADDIYEYFYIENENNKVIIDDTYKNFSFLFKEVIYASKGPVIGGVIMVGRSLPYSNLSEIVHTDEEFDIDSSNPDEYTSILVFRRSINGNPSRAGVADVFDSDKQKIGFRGAVYSSVSNDPIEIAAYYLGTRKPSDLGLVLWNENGEVVFDALKGFLQVVDTLNVIVDVSKSGIQSFELNIQASSVDFDKLFICDLNMAPFMVRGGTIVIDYRSYYSKLSRNETTGKVYLDLVMYGDGGNGGTIHNYSNVYSALIAYVPY